MMRPVAHYNPEYITDNLGTKKAVILSMEEYEELMEDLHDLAVLAERQKESTVSHTKVVEELRPSLEI
jgi:PHD/YefM family antitoxin component YafN of YafNO toxin-antitoxin module